MCFFEFDLNCIGCEEFHVGVHHVASYLFSSSGGQPVQVIIETAEKRLYDTKKSKLDICLTKKGFRLCDITKPKD